MPGESVAVEITYVIVSDTGNITNTAEISDDDSEEFGTTDIDSVPDATNDDVLGADNQLDGNGTDDEDDSDVALIDFSINQEPVVINTG